jgi:quinol monooxygenase YgiN
VTVVEIIHLPVAAERADALVDAIRAGRSSYLAAPRCERVQVLRGAGSTEVAVVARWASQAAHDEAAAEPATKAFLDDVGRLAAGPPSLGFFVPV